MDQPIAAPPPAFAPLSRGLLLAPRGLSVPRTAVAFAGAAAALVALVLGAGRLEWLEVGLLGTALVAMLFDRVDAHVFVRSVLWGVLIHGATGLVDVFEVARPLTILVGSAASLLSLGRAGLDGEHGSFFPIVMRRSLLTMMVVGLSVAHVMAVVAVSASGEVWTLLATALVAPTLLLVGVVGLSRTRSWGLLAYVAGLLSAAASFALFTHPPSAWAWGAFEHQCVPPTGVLALGSAVGGMVALAAALPVLLALVVKPRARPAGKGWGQHVHAAMVLAVVGLALYAAVST